MYLSYCLLDIIYGQFDDARRHFSMLHNQMIASHYANNIYISRHLNNYNDHGYRIAKVSSFLGSFICSRNVKTGSRDHIFVITMPI